MLSRPPSRSPSSAAPRNTGRPNPLGYLPALDGLRALAVAAVVAYHLGYSGVPGGYIGVEVFFVLSGWLVCALLVAEHRASGGIDLRAFWLRRARRLLPAVTLVIGTTLVVALQTGYQQFASLRGDGFAALAYVLNWHLIIDRQSYFEAAATGPSPLQHLWSLSIEEQFYLALPLLLGLTLAGRRTARHAALLALGAAVVGTVWRLVVDAPGADPSRLYYGTDTRAAALLVGAALALVWVPERLRPVPGRWAGPLLDVVAVASLAVLGWYTFEVGERDPDAFGWSLTVVQLAGLTLIAVVVHPVRGLVARLLGLPPLRWIGQRSYGIYLWHWPLIVLLAKAPGEQPEAPARTTGIVLATLAVAAVSYRLVEQPIRRHGVADSISLARRWTARRIAGRPVLTGALTAVAIVGYVGGVLLARDIVAADDTGTDTPPTVLAAARTDDGDDDGRDGDGRDGEADDRQPCDTATAPATGPAAAPSAPVTPPTGATGDAPTPQHAIPGDPAGSVAGAEPAPDVSTPDAPAGDPGTDPGGRGGTTRGSAEREAPGATGSTPPGAGADPGTPDVSAPAEADATAGETTIAPGEHGPPAAGEAKPTPLAPDDGDHARRTTSSSNPGGTAAGRARHGDERRAPSSGGANDVAAGPDGGGDRDAGRSAAGDAGATAGRPGGDDGAEIRTSGRPGQRRGCPPEAGRPAPTPEAPGALPPGDPGVAGATPGAPGLPPDAAPPAPAPAPPPAPALPWTTAVGDSVMLGAAPALEARFGPQLVLEATVGFQMVDAPDLVQRLADEDRLGDVLIVHLGANGPFPDSTLDDIVAIAGDRPVLLVEVKVPRRWEAEVNDRIAAAAERHPNVVVIDWRTVSESEDGLLWRDGHHLTPAGAERYADLLASYAASALDR